MQGVAPELMDIGKESKATLEMYGAEPGKASFANNCLLARRLVEKGVRFVQLYHEAWDQHSNLVKDLQKNCLATDRASAALIKDLKQRGLLEDTLVVWGGEFGRTPFAQISAGQTPEKYGRDHNPWGFSMFMAGGGVKGGQTIGSTDDLGLRAAEDPYHVWDIHASILNLLGLNHLRTTYMHNGRAERPTVTGGNLIQKLWA